MFILFKLLGNKRLLFLMVALILFIALMGFTLGNRDKVTWPEKIVHDTVSFVQQIFYKPATAIANFFNDVANLREVYKENETLKIALAHYTRDKAWYNALEADNERYKEELGFTERQKEMDLPYDYRIAKVTSINVADPYNQTVNINLGERDGIKPGMAVISIEGIVGVISHAYEFSSSVQLLTNIDDKDTNSRAISATILGKENESFGMIESYDASTGYYLMTRIPEGDPLQKGDTVVSSDLGGRFPRGLVIGTVKSIRVGDFGLTQTAEVEPATSYQDWRELFVVVTHDDNSSEVTP